MKAPALDVGGGVPLAVMGVHERETKRRSQHGFVVPTVVFAQGRGVGRPVAVEEVNGVGRAGERCEKEGTVRLGCLNPPGWVHHDQINTIEVDGVRADGIRMNGPTMLELLSLIHI